MATAATSKRPRDRKAQIADAAGQLFADVGYHRVAIGDIAAAVGITGRAIYRHYENKQDLLATVVLDDVVRLEAIVEEHVEGVPSQGHVGALLEALAALTTDQRDLGLLVQRESRHLAGEAAGEFERRTSAMTTRVQRLVRALRPDLSAADADLLVRSAFAVLVSPAYHGVVLPRASAESLLRGMGEAVLATTAVPSPVRPAPQRRPAAAIRPRASRREMVLSAAIHLFARRGYSAVRMEDVGAAAGIAGPSIYEHFPSKVDILVAALTRGAEWLQFGLSRALTETTSPDEALIEVVRSYVDFVLGNTDLVAIFLSETLYLPEAEQHALRRVQHDYVAEWVNLLTAARPALTEPEARFLAHGVLGIVNDHARTERRHRVDDLRDILVGMGGDVLFRTEAGRKP